MKLNNVLIVHKKSTFQLQAIDFKESRFVKLLAEGADVLTRVKVAHSEHIETLELIKQELSKREIKHTAITRSELNQSITDVDLVITVGGDGTFLDASHYLNDIPLLGVNSSRSSSFGHFCAANERNLSTLLDDIQNDKFSPCQLSRLEISLNGQLLKELALNEILVAHANPAATSRYSIKIGNVLEEQRSSGVLIGTAAGSTGSIRSAGGTVLPITDRRFQYVVREPCMRPNENWQINRAILSPDKSIVIYSEMRTGALYVDGQHIQHECLLADEITISVSPHVLNAYIRPDVNDIFL